MANISAETSHLGGGVFRYAWLNVTEGDTPQPVECPAVADKSVEISGTFGGGAVSLQGSNGGSVYSALTDFDGSAITLSAAGLKPVRENPRFLKPNTPSGVSVSLNIYVIGKKVR